MAKTKKEEVLDETKVTDAQPDRVKVLEDLLADVQPALHRYRKQIPNSRVAEDSNHLYMKVRDTLGERGQEIDRTLRG